MRTAASRQFISVFLATAVIVQVCNSDLSAQSVAGNSTAERTLPIEFEPNHGQLPSNTLFLTRTGNVLLSLGRSELDIAVMTGRSDDRVIGFRFENANPNTNPVASEPTGGESSYLIGPTSAWHTHISHFRRVTYNQLYPGIDLAFYGAGSHVEHDFVVAPGYFFNSLPQLA